MNGEQAKSVPVTDRHNQSSVGAESENLSQGPASKRQWPITFPKIKDHYKRINPTVNEPIILRYSSKALFNTDCENLTYGKYKHFDQFSKQKKGGLMKSPTQGSLLPRLNRAQEEYSRSAALGAQNLAINPKTDHISRLPRITSKNGPLEGLVVSSNQTGSRNVKAQTEQSDGASPNKPRDWNAEDERKRVVVADGRKRLFTRFPEVKSVFARQHLPTNYLRESIEYECV